MMSTRTEYTNDRTQREEETFASLLFLLLIIQQRRRRRRLLLQGPNLSLPVYLLSLLSWESRTSVEEKTTPAGRTVAGY